MKKGALWTVLAAVVGGLLMAASARAADPPPCLAMARQGLEQAFGRLDARLKGAARTLGTAGLTGEGARAVLAELCRGFAYAVDCSAVDPAGRMVTVEPAAYRPHEGADISAQEQIRRLRKTGKPVLSQVFLAVEGFPAVDAEYPVVNPQGRRIGSVSLLFRPETLLVPIIAPLVQAGPATADLPEKGPLQIWAMEKSGTILYDADRPQVGQNLFTAALYRPYPALIELGRRIARLPEGEGRYEFLRQSGDHEVVTKRTWWQSASLYGTPWRLVAVQAAPKGDRSGPSAPSDRPAEGRRGEGAGMGR